MSLLENFDPLILKRDGSYQVFTKDKIFKVINNAIKTTKMTDSISTDSIHTMVDSVIIKCNDELVLRSAIKEPVLDIEFIQDTVEKTLMENGYYTVMKHFILYRQMRTEHRRTNGFDIKKRVEPSSIPFGPLGYVTYKRTYARRLNESGDETEEFEDTILRVLRACQNQLKVNFTKEELETAYEYLMNLKGSVAGRFLWQLGTKTVDNLGLMSLQNCAFTTVEDPIKSFSWIFDSLMLGVGVGASIQKQHVQNLPKVLDTHITINRKDTKDADFIIPDSREGWIKFLEEVLKAFFFTGQSFTYSTILIREAGTPIRGFGGTASGSGALCDGIANIVKILNNAKGRQLKPVECMDIINIIATIVVAGNIRRSALLIIGDPDDKEYLNAKRWDLGNIPNWRSMSNNSVNCSDISQLPDEFWEGYTGNGEPYGLVNIELSKKVGRLKDGSKYPDPDVAGMNPCTHLHSKILTENGIQLVEDLIGKKFTVLIDNKKYESTEQGFWCTGEKMLYTLTLNNGMKVEATDNHRFRDISGNFIEIKDMKINETVLDLATNTIKWNGGEGTFDEGYLLGNIIGDGSIGKKTGKINLIISKDFEVINYKMHNEIKRILENLPVGIELHEGRNTNKWIESSSYLRQLAIKYGIKPEEKNIPEKGSYAFIKGILRGIFDTDGCMDKPDKPPVIRLSQVKLERLESVQRLLLLFGIKSTIRKEYDAQEMIFPGNKKSMCKACYKLTITSKYLDKFNNNIGFWENKKADRLNKYCQMKKSPNSSDNRYQTVIKIEEKGIEKVYDCTINEKHCFSANGFVSHNCAEITLCSSKSKKRIVNGKEEIYNLGTGGETCCLSEIILPNIKSFDELKTMATILYRICKHSLLLDCHQVGTNEIVHNNMRIGMGVTGYMQCTEEQKSWLSHLYEYLREYDITYSHKIGSPTSIKLSCIKPSGSLSLLPGVTPGAHPAIYKYFIRRIRIASGNPLIDVCKKNGYHVEYQINFDGTPDLKTMVVEFPCRYPDTAVLANDLTAIDELEIVKRLQTEWSDNAVSVTIYYKLEELENIKEWLRKNYTNSVKSVSFLLHQNHGFKQAPYESISEELYNELLSKTTPITDCKVIIDDELDNLECRKGMCPIK